VISVSLPLPLFHLLLLLCSFCAQLFLRDAEQVDTATGAQEAFLSNDDLGVCAPSSVEMHCIAFAYNSLIKQDTYIATYTYMYSHTSPPPPLPSHQTSVDSVEALLKKHEEFEGTSAAHDDRIRSLSEQANKLIQAGHYDTTRWEQLQ